MSIEFNLGEAAQFALFFMAATVTVFLVIALYQIARFVKKLNEITASNAVHIGATLVLLPAIAGNVNDAAISVKESLSTVNNAVGVLDDTLFGAVGVVTAGADTVMNVINMARTVIQNVIRGFSHRKRK